MLSMAGVQAIQQPSIADPTDSADPSDSDRLNAVYRSLQIFCRLTAPLFFRFRARGLEHVPERGPALFVVNHQSFLDPMLVAIPLTRPIRFLARDTLYRGPVSRKILKLLCTIPVNRNAASSATIRAAASKLQQGLFVGIFPEGTRSENRQIGALKPGFIALVRRGNAPIIPVGIAGSGDAFPRGGWFVRPKTIRMVFGPPLETEMLAKLKGHGSEQALVDAVRDAMIRCYDEAREWQSR
jgi:1-acyl-sn-glycerol-3-phosphate acyltransferase